MLKSKVVILLVAMAQVYAPLAQAEELTLTKYVQQVESVGSDLQAAKLNLAGARLALEASELVDGIQFTTQLGHMDDARETMNPGFQGSRTIASQGAVGLKQSSSLGINWAFTQNYNRTSLVGASPLAIPVNEFTDIFPKLELNVPLWKNRGGGALEAQISQVQAQTKIQEVQAEVSYVQKLNEVEATYWNLILQQKLLKIQKENLQRAQKMYSWTGERRKKNLVEESDFAQAQAALMARKIELEMTQTNYKDAVRQFNKLRQNTSETVMETLKDDELNLAALNIKTESLNQRLELEAQRQNIKMQEAAQTIQEQNLKPTLDLNMMGLLFGRDNLSSLAYREMYDAKKYMYQIGIQFNYPLDIGTSSRARDGYRQMIEAQTALEKNIQFEEEVNKKKLKDTGLQLSEQIKLSRELAQVQKKKLEIENQKYRNGRSLLFQVLTFEQDFINAQVQQLQLEHQARNFLNQLKFYK